MPENTGGNEGAEKTSTGDVSPQNDTTPKDAQANNGQNDQVVTRGAEQRIQQLTAELKRKNELLENLRAKVEDLPEKTKTEEEKRIEELARERFGPQLQRLESLQQSLEAEFASVREKIPDEHRGLLLDDDSIPVERRLAHAREVLSFVTQKAAPQPVSGGSPAQKSHKPTYTAEDYRKWVNSSSSDLEYYKKHRDEMIAAIREGRVEGFGPPSAS